MMLPPSLQGSLPAGWLAFTGRESNPLDHDQRFPSCYISSPLPGFSLTLRHPKPVTRARMPARMPLRQNALIKQTKLLRRRDLLVRSLVALATSLELCLQIPAAAFSTPRMRIHTGGFEVRVAQGG